MADFNDAVQKLIDAAVKETAERVEKETAERVEKETAERVEKEIRERYDALQEGTFFTPIDKVWVPECSTCYQGAFENMRRQEKYYETVKEYCKIVSESKAQAAAKAACTGTRSCNRVLEVMSEIERGGSEGKSAGSRKNKGRRGKSKRNKTNANHSPANKVQLDNGEIPSSISALGSESSVASESNSSAEVSQVSNDSNGSVEDCFGRVPSSRAHMIPDSTCKFSYGVCSAGVCGVRGGDREFLRRLTKKMESTPLNKLRAPALHGECYDAKPAWIFVPICEREDILSWDTEQPYWVMAIAGGWTECQKPVSVEYAYSSLTTFYYKEKKRPLKKCDKSDIRKATERLKDMVLALADTLLPASEDTITPLTLQEENLGGDGGSGRSSCHSSAPPKHPNNEVMVLKKAVVALKKDGVKLPKLIEDIDFERVELVKFLVDPSKMDLFPDPWLLLMKAAINWSWRCGQKLYPACHSVHSEEEENEQRVVPSTPIPTIIECGLVPVTPDSDDSDLSVLS